MIEMNEVGGVEQGRGGDHELEENEVGGIERGYARYMHGIRMKGG